MKTLKLFRLAPSTDNDSHVQIQVCIKDLLKASETTNYWNQY